MRISGAVTASALVVAGLVTSGSAVGTAPHPSAPTAPEPRLAAATDASAAPGQDPGVGLVPAAPEPARKLTAMPASTDGLGLFDGTVPLQDFSLPDGPGAFGIPQIVLAAYRNAELALQSSDPGCGLSWNLLAGIGKVESNHAGGGRTDADGTTVGVIYGPALDGTLPGNEVIRAADGNYVRAIGPMQFLPGTWSRYATDAKGNGHPDPNNVFDAALAAGKYLCSGGLNLRDPQQELRAVLRYNDSVAYASQVLSWSDAYRTGGVPTQVSISPDLIPPDTMPEGAGSQMTAADSSAPDTAPAPVVTTTPSTPTPVMINIPGLPPIPCGIFCPPPQPNPCDPAAVPSLPTPGDKVTGEQRWAPGILGNQANSVEPLRPGGQLTPGGQTAPNAQQPNSQPAGIQLPGGVQLPGGIQVPGGVQLPGIQLPGAQPPQSQQPAVCTQPQAQGQPGPAQPNTQAPALAGTQQAQNPPKAPESGPAPSKTPEPGPAVHTPPVAPAPPAITLPFNIVIPPPPVGR
ncbi:lytic murein transglycosylase [Nocardia sp. GAS34]|uniref:lytic transglycosylase domain-containing protein n=1 Tax=unclassified Nocardia TaxID=2637762 RepID=UPI003D1D9907